MVSLQQQSTSINSLSNYSLLKVYQTTANFVLSYLHGTFYFFEASSVQSLADLSSVTMSEPKDTIYGEWNVVIQRTHVLNQTSVGVHWDQLDTHHKKKYNLSGKYKQMMNWVASGFISVYFLFPRAGVFFYHTYLTGPPTQNTSWKPPSVLLMWALKLSSSFKSAQILILIA